MTDHPLTETAAVELWEERCGYRFTDNTLAALAYEDMAQVIRPENHEKCLNAALSAALAVATPADPRHDPHPWEPLNGPVRVGDEVRQDHLGVTTIAVVGRVDEVGDPWATGGNFIGRIDFGTWYVRRHIQELPTEPDAVIERADGHKYITATVSGETYRAREAILSGERWLAVWRRDSGRGAISVVRSHEITPGTWKAEEK